MELPAVVTRQLQVTSIMATAPNHAHTATCAGVNSHTASRQLSEVEHVPAQPVLRWVTTLEPWVLNIFVIEHERQCTVMTVHTIASHSVDGWLC